MPRQSTSFLNGPQRCRAPLAAGLLCAVLAALLPGGCISPERAAKMEAAAAERSQLVGRPAVDFTLPNQDGKQVRMADLRGRWIVLYFYPEDGTPGCVCQAEEFTRTHAKFHQLEAEVYGVSPDPVASHRRMVDEHKVQVNLLADPDHKLMEPYGAWVKTPFGARVIRSTVLIDPDGKIAYHWPEVIPEGHADRVRAKLAELRAARASGPGDRR